MIGGRELVAIGPRGADVLFLCGRRPSVMLAREIFLRGGRTRGDAAAAAVVADVGVVDDDIPLINIVYDRDVYIVDAAVIEKIAAAPVAAGVADAGITETVVDATVEADLRSPVTGVPDVGAAIPAPVARGPEKSNRGRLDPSSRHPKISAIIAVAPISRRPDVAGFGANGLGVNGQGGRSNRDREKNLRRSDGRNGQCKWNREKSCGYQERARYSKKVERAVDIRNAHVSHLGRSVMLREIVRGEMECGDTVKALKERKVYVREWKRDRGGQVL